MRSMIRLLEWEETNQTAQFERFMASLMRVVAAGQHIDPDVSPRFSGIMEEAKRNPFEKRKRQPETAEEIKQYVLCRLEGKEWI